MKEPKEFDYFKAWLLFFLIATVGGGLIGMVIGSFVAAFLGAGGMHPAADDTHSSDHWLCHRDSRFLHHVSRGVGKYLLPKIEDDDDTPTNS
jgi:hypothetical protein